MRTFEIRVKVTGCSTCPYSTPDVYCTKIDDKHLEERDGGLHLNMQNRYQITESCPMYWLSKDKHE